MCAVQPDTLFASYIAPSQLASQNPPAQQATTPTAKEPQAGNGSAEPDVDAQIDELMKQCNEAMNVKVNFQRAAELAQQALDLSEKTGDKVRAANAMVYLGAALSYQGKLKESVAVAQKGVAVAREAGDKKVLAQMLNTAAGIIGEIGRYEEALALFYECLYVARESNDPVMQYMSLLNIGEAYVRSDDTDKAELPLQEALRMSHELKPPARAKKGTEMALLNLGAMEIARQHYREALGYYERVHASKPESSLWVVSALQGMAESYEQLDEPQKAIELLKEAMPIAEKAESGVEYRNLLSALGVNQEKLGNPEEALANENKALVLIHEGGGDPDTEWQVESRTAHIEHALGRNEEALKHYQKSIEGIESLRSVALNTEEGRAGVLGKSRAVYAEAADLLYETHHDGEALEMAERGRARAFLDMLAESRVGVLEEANAEQKSSEAAILGRISGIQKELWNEMSPEMAKKHEVELAAAEADLEAFHVAVRQSDPRYASVHYPEPVRVSEMQSELLDEHTALVEYLLGEKQSLAWVVTKSGIVTVALPPKKKIEVQANAYREALMQRVSALTVKESLGEIHRWGAQLYKLVFAPVEAAVKCCQRLIIVPDGALDYLPFEAMVTGSGYLAEKHAVVYGPSASALVTVRALNRKVVEPPKMLVAFADPVTSSAARGAPGMKTAKPKTAVERGTEGVGEEDYTERGFSLVALPYSREEVLSISKLFPGAVSKVYLGNEAREETVKSEKLADFRYVHFASHGFLDETRPGRSGILLAHDPKSSEDGILQVDEIMRLKMNADLVTLSACSTGLGKFVNGEGVLGLTRAFFYAGARNVAVSLWNVNDSATATLIGNFYRNLDRGLPKGEAMRRAKLAMLRGSQASWRHPYFWAAFVVEGEGL
jgi:CHAT domain-containing protein